MEEPHAIFAAKDPFLRAGFSMTWSIKALATVVVDELKGCTELVSRLIAEARQLSEREVLAAGRCVVSINNEAKQHATDLSALAKQFAGGNSENRRTIAHVIQKQTHTCSTFATELGAELRDQSELALRALELTKRIAKFGEQINSISIEARILTLNADIESKRLGKSGAAFGAIAGEMRNLSASVHSTNQAVADLTRDLTRLLPKLAAGSQQMLRHSDAFSGQLVKQLADVEFAYDSAQRAVHGTLQASQERAERIFAQTCEVLSHLQFQDRMAQDLSKAQHQCQLAAQIVEGAFAALPEASAAHTGDDWGTQVTQAFDRARQQTPVVVHMLAEGLSPAESDSVLQAGDVELF
jgi:methyl-accepting chemotaxis protein